MIPVLITSIMNRPDLLDRMLDSVDIHVDRGLIVDNGYTGYTRDFPHGNWRVFQPPFQSLGWPGTLNFGMMQTPDAPWWMFVNNDAWFDPGKLALLVETVEESIAKGEPAVFHHEWTVVALPRLVVERVGMFDEWNYWPLYFDDTDYSWRCHLEGIPVLNGEWCHEGDLDWTELKLEHAQTVRSDPVLTEANNRTWQLNRQAYVAKWGGPPGREKFTTPWGRDVPVWATKPDPEGRVARSWP